MSFTGFYGRKSVQLLRYMFFMRSTQEVNTLMFPPRRNQSIAGTYSSTCGRISVRTIGYLLMCDQSNSVLVLSTRVPNPLGE